MSVALTDTWYLFLKYSRITLRMPMWTLFGLVQPLIWLVIFGQLFAHFAKMAGFPSESYLDFLAPGIVVMTVLFGSSWAGVNLLREITYGTIEKMMVTAVNRPAMVLSRVLHNGVLVVLQVTIVLLVAAMLGAKIHVGASGLGLLFVTVFGMGIGFSSLSNGTVDRGGQHDDVAVDVLYVGVYPESVHAGLDRRDRVGQPRAL
jgi:ABC-2 type transport system permease protein